MSDPANTDEELRRMFCAHVLVVARQTATSSGLLEAVRKRAQHGEATFHLLVPGQPHDMQKAVDPQEAGADEAQQVLDVALPKLSEAAGQDVTGSVDASEPMSAIENAIHRGDYHEIIISTLPLGVSRWLRLDVVSKARRLGLPVTHVESSGKVEASAGAA
jgi:hypothetical protein